MIDPDLTDLLAAWAGGDDPGEARRDTLLARLRTDPTFRASVSTELRTVGMLKAVQSSEPRWLLLSDALGTTAADGPDAADDLAERVVRAGTARRRNRSVRRIAVMGAVAAVAVLGLALAVRPAKPLPTPPETDIEAAQVARLDNVSWELGQPVLEAGDAVGRGPLRLRAGRLRLDYHSGVSLVIQGPADLDLVDTGRVHCRRGNLRVHVPDGAEGFTLSAPGCEVVDPGTEFGLIAEPGQKLRLMAVEGVAAVSLLDGAGRPVLGEEVVAPRAVEVDTDPPRLRDIPPDPGQLARLPGPADPPPVPLVLPSDYPAKVRSADPWGYWRFEKLDGDRVANEVPGRPALRASAGGVRLGGKRGSNRWAVFDNDDPRESLVCAGDWTPPRAGGYAVEVWVQADPLGRGLGSRSQLVSVIQGDGTSAPHVSLLELAGRTRHTPPRPCMVRFLDRWPAALEGGANVYSRQTIDETKWHHLVGQKAGDKVELYVDGELVGTSPAPLNAADAASATGPCTLLVGRMFRAVGGSKAVYRPFRGRLDELAVYDRPLTPDEVHGHSGPPRAGRGEK